MSKLIIRIVAFLLVPCLVADPVNASAFLSCNSIPHVTKLSINPSRFEEQALADRALSALCSLFKAPVKVSFERELEVNSRKVPVAFHFLRNISLAVVLAASALYIACGGGASTPQTVSTPPPQGQLIANLLNPSIAQGFGLGIFDWIPTGQPDNPYELQLVYTGPASQPNYASIAIFPSSLPPASSGTTDINGTIQPLSGHPLPHEIAISIVLLGGDADHPTKITDIVLDPNKNVKYFQVPITVDPTQIWQVVISYGADHYGVASGNATQSGMRVTEFNDAEKANSPSGFLAILLGMPLLLAFIPGKKRDETPPAEPKAGKRSSLPIDSSVVDLIVEFSVQFSKLLPNRKQFQVEINDKNGIAVMQTNGRFRKSIPPELKDTVDAFLAALHRDKCHLDHVTISSKDLVHIVNVISKATSQESEITIAVVDPKIKSFKDFVTQFVNDHPIRDPQQWIPIRIWWTHQHKILSTMYWERQSSNTPMQDSDYVLLKDVVNVLKERLPGYTEINMKRDLPYAEALDALLMTHLNPLLRVLTDVLLKMDPHEVRSLEYKKLTDTLKTKIRAIYKFPKRTPGPDFIERIFDEFIAHPDVRRILIARRSKPRGGVSGPPEVKMSAPNSLAATWGGPKAGVPDQYWVAPPLMESGVSSSDNSSSSKRIAEATPEEAAGARTWDLLNLNRLLKLSIALRRPLISNGEAINTLEAIRGKLGLPELPPDEKMTAKENQELARRIDALLKRTPTDAVEKKEQALSNQQLALQLGLAEKLIRRGNIAAALAALTGSFNTLLQKSRRTSKSGFPILPVRNWFGELVEAPAPRGPHIIDPDGVVWWHRLNQDKTLQVAPDETRVLRRPTWYCYQSIDNAFGGLERILIDEDERFDEVIAHLAQVDLVHVVLNEDPSENSAVVAKRTVGELAMWVDEGYALGRKYAGPDVRGALTALEESPPNIPVALDTINRSKMFLEEWRLPEILGTQQGIRNQIPKLAEKKREHENYIQSIRALVQNMPTALEEQIQWWEKLNEVLERPDFHGHLRETAISREKFNHAFILMDGKMPVEHAIKTAIEMRSHIIPASKAIEKAMEGLRETPRDRLSRSAMESAVQILTPKDADDLDGLEQTLLKKADLWKNTVFAKNIVSKLNYAASALTKTYLIPLSNPSRRVKAAKILVNAVRAIAKNEKRSQEKVQAPLDVALKELDAANGDALDVALEVVYPSALATGKFPNRIIENLNGLLSDPKKIPMDRNAIQQNLEAIRDQVLNVLSPSQNSPSATSKTAPEKKSRKAGGIILPAILVPLISSYVLINGAWGAVDPGHINAVPVTALVLVCGFVAVKLSQWTRFRKFLAMPEMKHTLGWLAFFGAVSTPYAALVHDSVKDHPLFLLPLLPIGLFGSFVSWKIAGPLEKLLGEDRLTRHALSPVRFIVGYGAYMALVEGMYWEKLALLIPWLFARVLFDVFFASPAVFDPSAAYVQKSLEGKDMETAAAEIRKEIPYFYAVVFPLWAPFSYLGNSLSAASPILSFTILNFGFILWDVAYIVLTQNDLYAQSQKSDNPAYRFLGKLAHSLSIPLEWVYERYLSGLRLRYGIRLYLTMVVVISCSMAHWSMTTLTLIGGLTYLLIHASTLLWDHSRLAAPALPLMVGHSTVPALAEAA